MPALPDKTTVAELGGVLADYQPLEDATTDQPAAADNLIKANVAMGSRTAIRAWVQFTVPPGGTGLATVNAHDALWGNDPSVQPTVSCVTINGDTACTVQWPATVLDALATNHATNLRAAWGNIEQPSATAPVIWCSVVGAAAVLAQTGPFIPPGTVVDVFAI